MVRPRNPRGEGGKLRTEILAAAAALLDETASVDAVTLRAVARRVGISAPSIYAHFLDREAMLIAVIDDAFAELIDALTQAIASKTDPVDRLRAGCAAYLHFAAQRPQPYRVMFQLDPSPSDKTVVMDETGLGAQAFGVLVDSIKACADAGRSASTDPSVDAAAVWVAMHGYALLRTALPGFTWPAHEQMFDRIVLRLAGVTAPNGTRRRR